MNSHVVLETRTVPTNGEGTASFDPNHVQQFRLQPKLAEETRDAIQQALQDLGHETAEMILLYARTRRNVDVRKLPLGIEDLDSVLYETLGTGRRMIVNHCATLLSERIGRVIRAKSDRLSDLFRQVMIPLQGTSEEPLRYACRP